MNRRIAFYYTFLFIIATMFTVLGNYQNINATSTFSGLSNGTLNSNLNGTLNILTPFNDEADNTESNNLKDCANCIGNNDINPSTSTHLLGNDNGDDGDNDRANEDDIGISGDGGNDRANEDDVLEDSPFSLPFNSQFADSSGDIEDDISDRIPFP